MTDALSTVLAHLGHRERAPQRRLFEHLLTADRRGVIAQAGTGVGKSLAVLSAAYQLGGTSLVVVPTNVLLSQYADKDAPAFAEATGAVVRTLKGRQHYLCSSARGWMLDDALPPERLDALAAALRGEDIVEVRPNEHAFGCPGSEECSPEGLCHYRRAKDELEGADIIVTNAHLCVIDASLKEYNQLNAEEGPRIFPAIDQQFVDEAHTFEEVVRSFTSLSISSRTTRRMGDAGDRITAILSRYHGERDATAIERSEQLGAALADLAAWRPLPGQRNQRFLEASRAAWRMLQSSADVAAGHVVLWVEPRPDAARLVMTRVSIASLAGRTLSQVPFGMVSATVPVSMAPSLGVPAARFIDVGHPFDYGRQARLGFSAFAGDYQSSQSRVNFQRRCEELLAQIRATRGGALVLFSAFRDLRAVHEYLAPRLAGRTVLVHDGEVDKAELGRRFKEDGSAVLFASKSFATGFDAPGDALQLVAIWKLPYPGNSPVMDVIRQRSWQRYEDAMLVDVTQAIGRLIRTAEDTGTVWVCDSRGGTKLLGRPDPLLRHLSEFARV